ncbi:hypothetical protein B0H19DRAFT_1141182 [Mycena capillaripes]|nr:hypothetical protein B0H19DRAFT_1141182 [Mycena capillaripes]
MKLPLFIAVCAALVCAETVTLFGFQPNGYPNNAVSLSVAGVGADGATTYVEEILQSAVVYGDADGTNTAVNAVQTLHATLVADASVYRYTMLPTTAPDRLNVFGVVETCTLDGKGGGRCVAAGWADGGPTATTTFSGQVAPFYTLIVGDAHNQSPSKNGAAKVSVRVLACVAPGLLLFFL